MILGAGLTERRITCEFRPGPFRHAYARVGSFHCRGHANREGGYYYRRRYYRPYRYGYRPYYRPYGYYGYGYRPYYGYGRRWRY